MMICLIVNCPYNRTWKIVLKALCFFICLIFYSNILWVTKWEFHWDTSNKFRQMNIIQMLFVRKYFTDKMHTFNDEISCSATLSLDTAFCHSDSIRMSICLVMTFNNIALCHFN